MTTAELLAAAATLEKHLGDGGATIAEYMDSARLLAAWVREQCDETPVTEEWLRSIGWTSLVGGDGSLYGPTFQRFCYYGGWIHVCGVFGRITQLVECKSRGQVRRLLAALGMDVKS